MFIIKQGKAFIIDGEKANQIKFNDDLTYKVMKETVEVPKDATKYNLEEVIAKLNVRYEIETKLEEEALSSMGDEKLLEKMEKLEEALAEKEAEVEELLEKLSSLTKPVENEQPTDKEPSKEQ